MTYAKQIAKLQARVRWCDARILGFCCRDPQGDAALIRAYEDAIAYFERLGRAA